MAERSKYGFSQDHKDMFFWNSYHKVWSKIIDVFDDALVEIVITPIGWLTDTRVHVPDVGRVIKTHYAIDNTDIFAEQLPAGVIEWLYSVDVLKDLIKDGVIESDDIIKSFDQDLNYDEKYDADNASTIDTEKGMIAWTYPGVINPYQARNIQHARGYHSAGYGFYGHTIDNKVTRWECSQSCD